MIGFRSGRAIRTGLLLAAGLVVSGCLSSSMVVTVRPDGSGTLEQTTVFRAAGMTLFETLFPPEPGAAPRPPFGAIMGERLRSEVSGKAPYIQLVSSRPVRTADAVGETAVFAFTDVSALDLDLLPATPVPVRGFLPSIGVAHTDLAFTMATNTAGNPVLTVRFPRFSLDAAAEPPGAWATGTPQEMATFKRALQGARVTIVVQGETPLLSSNSPHRTGNGVTLFDLRADEALFSRQIDMLRATPASFDELLRMLGDLPGVTVADDRVVTLEFQGAAAPPPAPPGPCHQASTDTEIYLAPLTWAGTAVTLGRAVDISNSPGYDNQPSFTGDGRAVLFTSDRSASGTATAGQTDIYRYDIADGRMTQVTRTPECEYSPSVAPGGRISVVRVEADRTQRLWSFTQDGSDPSLVLRDIKPVGYHAWMTDRLLALFVLGTDGKPSTLQVADTRTGQASVVATDIGRSLQRMPNGRVSFVQHEPRTDDRDRGVALRQLFTAGDGGGSTVGTALLAPVVSGSTEPYPVWLPDGTGLMAHADTLYAWRAGDPEWRPVADLAAAGLRTVSRLAVSPKGDWLALVAAPR